MGGISPMRTLSVVMNLLGVRLRRDRATWPERCPGSLEILSAAEMALRVEMVRDRRMDDEFLQGLHASELQRCYFTPSERQV